LRHRAVALAPLRARTHTATRRRLLYPRLKPSLHCPTPSPAQKTTTTCKRRGNTTANPERKGVYETQNITQSNNNNHHRPYTNPMQPIAILQTHPAQHKTPKNREKSTQTKKRKNLARTSFLLLRRSVSPQAPLAFRSRAQRRTNNNDETPEEKQGLLQRYKTRRLQVL
jgi:hypothetical protein